MNHLIDSHVDRNIKKFVENYIFYCTFLNVIIIQNFDAFWEMYLHRAPFSNIIRNILNCYLKILFVIWIISLVI